MTNTDFQTLVVDTVRTPSEAAARVLSFELPRQWLWMALALMSVLNSIVYSVSIRISPPSDPMVMEMIPPAFQSPVLFTIFLFGVLVISTFVMQWIGQAMGGKGSLTDILLVVTWLQVVRLILQAAVLVLSLVSPFLGGLLALIGSIWGIFILASFLDVAHRFDNIAKAVGVMVLALLAMLIGLSVIITVIGGVIVGGAGYV